MAHHLIARYRPGMLKPLPFGGVGLTGLKLEDLKRLLRFVHDETLSCPITTKELHMSGMSYLEDRVGFLRGLDARGVRAVLVAVIAERTVNAK